MNYPQITFSNSKSFPTVTPSNWRDSIAIIGEFSRGPAGALIVTPEQYETLYGRDSATGSVAVQQAISQGATNITISRAIPQDSGSSATISFGSGNQSLVEPRIGYEVNGGELNPTINETDYTIGLSLDLKFIGDPVFYRSTVAKVTTKDSELDHPSFTSTNEQATIEFIATAFVAGNASPEVKHLPADVMTITTVAGVVGDYQVISIATDSGTNADYSDIDQAILPGYELTDGTLRLQIASKPFSIGTDLVGVLVKNMTVPVGGLVTNMQVFDPLSDVYVMGYRSILTQNNSLVTRAADSKYFTTPSAEYEDDYGTIPLDSYFLLDANNQGSYIEFKYQYIGNSTIQSSAYAVSQEGFSPTATEGIQLLFGNKGVSGFIPMLIGGHFGVPIASGYVTVGSDNENSSLALTIGTDLSSVINDLYNAIFASTTFKDLVEDVIIDTSFFPYSINIVSSLPGTSSNRIDLALIKHVKGTASLAKDVYADIGSGYSFEFDLTSGKLDMAGAFNGPRRSFKDFYSISGEPILRVFAQSPGSTSIKVSLTPQNSLNPSSTRFLLNVSATINGVEKLKFLT